MPIWAVSHEAGLRRAGELVNVPYRWKRRKAAVATVSASWGRYRSAGHPLGTVVRVNCPSIRAVRTAAIRRGSTANSWCVSMRIGRVGWHRTVITVRRRVAVVSIRGVVVHGSHNTWLSEMWRQTRRPLVECPGIRVAHVHAKRADGLLLLPLGFVLVVGVLLHVCFSQLLRLLDVRSLFLVRESFPLRSQSFADFRVVHFRILVRDLLSHLSRPDHERVHGSFHFIVVVLALWRLSLWLGWRGWLHGVAIRRGIRREGHDMHHQICTLSWVWERERKKVSRGGVRECSQTRDCLTLDR